MAAQTFDDRDGWIWYDGKLVPWRDAKSARSDPRAPLRQRRLRGRARLRRHDFQVDPAFRAAAPFGARPRFRAALQRRRDRRGQSPDAAEERLRRRLCAAGRLARLGDDGRLGPAQQDPSGDRGVGMAELFRPGPADEGHPPRPRRISPPRSGDRALARQGGGPLHDLHDLQASRRAQRLRRRDDARLAGPRRRMHRRQHFLRQGRRHPHADRRLLPRRHHPPDGDRAGAPARRRSRRTAHHARRAGGLQRVLHHRHGGGSDAGRRNRRADSSPPGR